jgi:hypothetical protein
MEEGIERWIRGKRKLQLEICEGWLISMEERIHGILTGVVERGRIRI